MTRSDAPGWVLLEDFVPGADALFAMLREELAWTTQMASRQTASLGIPYNYPGGTYPEAPWHPAVDALRPSIAATFGFMPTNCLINRYPTGEHTIGWHRDDVHILAPGTGIVILTLGATRTLLLRRGEDPDFEYTAIPLGAGSALWLSQDLQGDHKHAIKREPGAGERISLTFRHLTHAPPPVVRDRWGG